MEQLQGTVAIALLRGFGNTRLIVVAVVTVLPFAAAAARAVSARSLLLARRRRRFVLLFLLLLLLLGRLHHVVGWWSFRARMTSLLLLDCRGSVRWSEFAFTPMFLSAAAARFVTRFAAAFLATLFAPLLLGRLVTFLAGRRCGGINFRRGRCCCSSSRGGRCRHQGIHGSRRGGGGGRAGRRSRNWSIRHGTPSSLGLSLRCRRRRPTGRNIHDNSIPLLLLLSSSCCG
mmetsp:Transcript_5089/g.14312  ORF Transcript_5089/g.14312 Transcript_5089/m.14312 type:complete len:230 (+) Transcript_5089:225-914(+)